MKSNYKVLMNLMLKSNTTRIETRLPSPLTLDVTKNNYLQLYSYRYSNVFCNITEDLIISPGNSWNISGWYVPQATLSAPALISLEAIYEWFKTNTNNLIIPSINAYGKCQLDFDASVVSVNITNLACLNTMYFGYFTDNITTVSTKTSPLMPSVSKFNNVVLTSSIVGANTLISDDKNNLISSQGLVVNAADGSLGQTMSFISNFPILYPINGNQISTIIFELRDENNQPLTILENATTDMFVWCMIVQD